MNTPIQVYLQASACSWLQCYHRAAYTPALARLEEIESGLRAKLVPTTSAAMIAEILATLEGIIELRRKLEKRRAILERLATDIV